ncbi:MAG TPA: hypothetical protein VFP90_04030 [Gemmatimonadaceae bacterium]|nr:hypothetical protein [Gemmatimonadaceae bacterium]
MHAPAGREPPTRREAGSIGTLRPARGETRHDRMREIRRRLADDSYRSPVVAEEIARRILISREP